MTPRRFCLSSKAVKLTPKAKIRRLSGANAIFKTNQTTRHADSLSRWSAGTVSRLEPLFFRKQASRF